MIRPSKLRKISYRALIGSNILEFERIFDCLVPGTHKGTCVVFPPIKHHFSSTMMRRRLTRLVSGKSPHITHRCARVSRCLKTDCCPQSGRWWGTTAIVIPIWRSCLGSLRLSDRYIPDNRKGFAALAESFWHPARIGFEDNRMGAPKSNRLMGPSWTCGWEDGRKRKSPGKTFIVFPVMNIHIFSNRKLSGRILPHHLLLHHFRLVLSMEKSSSSSMIFLVPDPDSRRIFASSTVEWGNCRVWVGEAPLDNKTDSNFPPTFPDDDNGVRTDGAPLKRRCKVPHPVAVDTTVSPSLDPKRSSPSSSNVLLGSSSVEDPGLDLAILNLLSDTTRSAWTHS